MRELWAARLGDRIRVQAEPFAHDWPPDWEVRDGEVSNALADKWDRGGGDGTEEQIWERLTAR